MSKLTEIINGWKNAAFGNKQIEILAAERMSICNECPHKIQMMAVDICELCHCPLFAKTRSPESNCPKGYWVEKKEDNI